MAEDFFSFSLTIGTLFFTSRRDTTYRLILIIAPRRRDASNRRPPPCPAESNCDRSSIDQPRPLAVVIADVHRSSTACIFFFSIFLIALRALSSSIAHSISHSLAHSCSQFSSWQIVSRLAGIVIQLEDGGKWNCFIDPSHVTKDMHTTFRYSEEYRKKINFCFESGISYSNDLFD